MEQIKIKAVTEEDFDRVIASAGGSRILDEGSADYLLNDAFIELKLIIEEGFEKTKRQTKLANLFRNTQSNQPVVLIDPGKLDPTDRRSYYRIIEAPIKSACKKASKQLQVTAAKRNRLATRVLVILNVGYTLLSPEEFKDVCSKCVRNDTTGIDWVVCGGLYFFSDAFDNYVFTRFEDFPIQVGRPFPGHAALLEAWNDFFDTFMTDFARNPVDDGRMPVIDLFFDLEGIRYIKPAPAMPPSTFWPGGKAPRINTSGIESCPVVANTFPSISETSWNRFKNAMPTCRSLKATYKNWLQSYPNPDDEPINPLKPLAFVPVEYEAFEKWIQLPAEHWQFSDIAQFAVEVYQELALVLISEAKDTAQMTIFPATCIHLALVEIGKDKANDMASIYFESEMPGFERREVLVENTRLFFEYGIALATAYAIKLRVSTVVFSKRIKD